MAECKCISEQPRIFKKDVDLLDSDKLNKMSSLANVLSDPIRLQILYLLKQHKDICTCEFQELLDLSQSKVSYHLKILLDAGLINREVIANWRHYSLIDKDILEKLEQLMV
ncbi:MAG: metalloregulator ArsR/SmtB family transcription factor [Synergistaceae bacterium]|jgi:ArsR family transcriptional regulator|nr:metalloregulator ArsR/SmtB family transcription factor [Synergistaceae bacterium]MCK9436761.1 metalloregulator ArsR/SmtB family transcription factor [Synergistaceae bacterium]MCK9558287.1 metalloregulator ArsR/SmtB family transcription factor [Candidatus Cloacimonadota bacterium]MDD5421693.1 metalloregulator ArsR/SmtB family transcription factor [Synergistaceae bacterium]MDY0283367.1 metalloregulator ArsR/SmtB family transcription factor [Synergistaceae bacterium]